MRDHAAVRRGLAIASTALITAGLVLLADVGITLAWKEPVSSLYGELKQRQAEEDLADLQESFPRPGELTGLSGPQLRRAQVLSRRFAKRIHTGEGIGRVKIPALDLDIVMVQGTDTASLQRGPGHYPDTRLPGGNGTVGIAGHRTTYLAPFRHIDQLHKGDEIDLEMPYGNFRYTVEQTKVVDDSALGIVQRVGHERVVLTACHPLYSAAKRYAVFGRLTAIGLAGKPSPGGG
jgi:sortase A